MKKVAIVKYNIKFVSGYEQSIDMLLPLSKVEFIEVTDEQYNALTEFPPKDCIVLTELIDLDFDKVIEESMKQLIVYRDRIEQGKRREEERERNKEERARKSKEKKLLKLAQELNVEIKK